MALAAYHSAIRRLGRLLLALAVGGCVLIQKTKDHARPMASRNGGRNVSKALCFRPRGLEVSRKKPEIHGST
jgi:hypothetical protein